LINPHEEASLLGKRKKRTYISPEERRRERKRKKEECIELTLDEKRADEADDIKSILKKYENELLHIKEWLKTNFQHKQSKNKFKKLEGMFCDCILLPRLVSLFPTYNDYEAKLRSKGL